MHELDRGVFLDVEEAARLARRSAETIRRWVRSGKLAASRQGRRLVIARDDVTAAAQNDTDPAVTLADWAASARRSLTSAQHPTRGSAADLVLGDRRQRSESPTVR